MTARRSTSCESRCRLCGHERSTLGGKQLLRNDARNPEHLARDNDRLQRRLRLESGVVLGSQRTRDRCRRVISIGSHGSNDSTGALVWSSPRAQTFVACAIDRSESIPTNLVRSRFRFPRVGAISSRASCSWANLVASRVGNDQSASPPSWPPCHSEPRCRVGPKSAYPSPPGNRRGSEPRAALPR